MSDCLHVGCKIFLKQLAADAEDFGFTAEDIGDYIYDVLYSYSRSFDVEIMRA